MDGLGLLVALIGLTILIPWLLRHDKSPGSKTRGIFAMKEPEGGAGATDRPHWQGGARRPPRAPAAPLPPRPAGFAGPPDQARPWFPKPLR